MMQLKGKILKILIVTSVINLSPISVSASTQPNGEYNPEEIEIDNPVAEILSQIPEIYNRVESLFQNINSGNLEVALTGILGAMGLLNPAHESSAIEAENNPYGNPELPEEVYSLERHADVVRSQIPQNLSQIVFSEEGQLAMAEQSAQIKAVLEAANGAGQATVGVYGESAQTAGQGTERAANVEILDREAQAANASQDVLKALSAQNQDIARIMAGQSQQLADLGEMAVYHSTQLSGLNTQLAALNQQGQTQQILLASQNYLLSQLDDGLDRQQQYLQDKDSIENKLNRNMSQMVYIPGLFE